MQTYSIKRVIKPGECNDAQLGAIVVDSLMYLATNANYSDIRILDKDHNEVPYSMVRVHGVDTVKVLRELTPELISFRELRDNQVEFIYRKSSGDFSPEQIKILSPNKNFEKEISVWGSNDSVSWQPVVENKAIFDYSRYVDMRSTEISFEAANYYYFKIVINNISEPKRSPFSKILSESHRDTVVKMFESFTQHQQLFRVDKIVFGASVPEINRRIPKIRPVALALLSEEHENGISELLFESYREPLRNIHLKFKDGNFRRKYTLLGTNDTSENSDWSVITNGEIYNVNIDGFRRSRLGVNLGAARRYRRYLLRIQNFDNPPLRIESATGEAQVYELVFFVNEEKSLDLVYGSKNARAPKYDVSSVLSHISDRTVQRWVLGEPVTVAIEKDAAQQAFDPKVIMKVSLVLMVCGLLGAVFIAVRKLESSDNEGV
ncbi:hypothetical protein CHISP_3164 [Chitinispirillum alkaliphilum]|nr:hypothetical protein CHISP_3164 [Chitinispirillum alkaliphilum]